MWTLFVLVVYSGYGVSLESTQFNNKDSCLNAATFSQKQDEGFNNNIDIKAWCVK